MEPLDVRYGLARPGEELNLSGRPSVTSHLINSSDGQMGEIVHIRHSLSAGFRRRIINEMKGLTFVKVGDSLRRSRAFSDERRLFLVSEKNPRHTRGMMSESPSTTERELLVLARSLMKSVNTALSISDTREYSVNFYQTDLGHVAVGPLKGMGYAPHNDGGCLLLHDANEPDDSLPTLEEMVVVTFVFSSSMSPNTDIVWRDSRTGDQLLTLCTGGNDIHVQLYNVQSIARHEVRLSGSCRAAKEDWRAAVSFRFTGPAQKTPEELADRLIKAGIGELSKKQLNHDEFTGVPHSFTTRLKEKTEDKTERKPAAKAGRKCSGDAGKVITAPQDAVPANVVAPYSRMNDLWTVDARSKEENMTRSYSVALGAGTVEAVASFDFMARLLPHKVNVRFLDADGNSIGYCGPHLTEGKPTPIGSPIDSDVVKSEMGMNDLRMYSKPWSETRVDGAELFTINLTRTYKNPELDRELSRIIQGQRRNGFHIGGCGGAPKYAGTSAGTFTTVNVSAVIGESQKLSKGPNLSLLEAVGGQRVVRVYRKCTDRERKHLYMGCYYLRHLTYGRTSMSDIRKLVGCIGKEGDADFQRYIRYLEGTHASVWLEPIDVDKLLSEAIKATSAKMLNEDNVKWKTMVVDSSQHLSCKIQGMPDLSTRETAVTVNFLLDTYFPTKWKTLGRMYNWDGSVSGGQETNEDSIPCDVGDGPMVAFEDMHESDWNSTLTPADVVRQMVDVSVALAARLLRMNVKDNIRRLPSDKYGLMDESSSYVGVLRAEEFPYLSKRERLRPSPFPIRTYDTCRLLFIQSSKGRILGRQCNNLTDYKIVEDGRRFLMDRSETFMDLLVGAVTMLLTGRCYGFYVWSKWAGKDFPSLPGKDDMTSFAAFFLAETNLRWTTAQYKIPGGLREKTVLVRTLQKLARTVGGTYTELTRCCTRMASIEAISSWLVDSMGLSYNPSTYGSFLKFISCQAVADIEEVLQDPFGKVVDVIPGYGAQAFIARVDKHWKRISKKADSKEGVRKRKRQMGATETLTREYNLKSNDWHVLSEVLDAIKQLTQKEILVLGLQRDGNNKILTQLNGREVNLQDAEHIMCKAHICRRRMLPAERLSSRCQPWTGHTHPICGLSFGDVVEGIAKMMLQSYKSAKARGESKFDIKE